MRGLWNRLRNGKALWSAYRNVNTLTGDDLASEPLFAHLREFAAAPSEPGTMPAGLIGEFTASQKRARGRKKFRFGAGALFATIILFPGLAYAGVLPTSVARVVQRIFNATSVPIQIPSVTKQSARSGGATQKSGKQSSDSNSQMPKAGSTEPSSEDGSSTPAAGEDSTSEPKPIASLNVPSSESPTGTSIEGGVSISSNSSDDSDLVQGTLGLSESDDSN